MQCGLRNASDSKSIFKECVRMQRLFKFGSLDGRSIVFIGGMKPSVRLSTVGRLTGKWQFFDITTFELALRLQTYCRYMLSININNCNNDLY